MEDIREILIEGKKTPMDTKKTVIIKQKKSEAVAGWEQQAETNFIEEL